MTLDTTPSKSFVAAMKLSTLLTTNAPKTTRGRDGQTRKHNDKIVAIFTELAPEEVAQSRTLVCALLNQVFVRSYMVSSVGDRVVTETTQWVAMMEKFETLCEVALLGRRLLPPSRK